MNKSAAPSAQHRARNKKERVSNTITKEEKVEERMDNTRALTLLWFKIHGEAKQSIKYSKSACLSSQSTGYVDNIKRAGIVRSTSSTTQRHERKIRAHSAPHKHDAHATMHISHNKATATSQAKAPSSHRARATRKNKRQCTKKKAPRERRQNARTHIALDQIKTKAR